ncbi:HAD family hydrolase [Planctomycetota bacterium]
MGYKAIIFDLDGTLLNTLQDLADSMNRILTAEGLPVHPTDAYRYFVGDGIRNLVKRSLPEGMREGQKVEELKQAMLDDYSEHWADATRPYTGVPEMLRSLEDQGLPMAILSNKTHTFTIRVVERLLSEHNFSHVLGARENVPIKPDPAAAFELAGLLDLDPDCIAYAGDTSTDMKTGIAAGFFTIGVTWGFRPPEELLEHGAQALVDKPEELVSLIA